MLSLISSRNHCQRFSPPQISDTPQAGLEPAQILSLDTVECSCIAVIYIALQHPKGPPQENENL